jgi:release factor glutamine methyltransferase
VQYLVGEWDFHDINLLTEAPILIPRPETEELVEILVQRFGNGNAYGDKIRFLDIGCGGGAIGLAVLHALPQSECIAVDANPKAVDLATRNAKRMELAHREQNEHDDSYCITPRYECIHVSVEELELVSPNFDFIVSNPPYIPNHALADLQPEVRDFESMLALDGGDDGMTCIKEILRRSPEWLRPGEGSAREVRQRVKQKCH